MNVNELATIGSDLKRIMGLKENTDIIDFNIWGKSGSGILTVELHVKIDIDVNRTPWPVKIDKEMPVKVRKTYTKKVKTVQKYTNKSFKGLVTFDRDFEISQNDFAAMRILLRDLRKNGKLTQEEVEHLSTFGGLQYKTMNEPQKDFFFNTFSKIRMDFLAGNRSKTRHEAKKLVGADA